MYSQAKVIAGGLAHIPVVIAVFYFILTTFNKRALKFVEETKTKKPEAKAVEPKKVAVSKIEAPKTEAPKIVKKKHADVPVNIYRPKTHSREQSLITIVFSKKELLVELIT